MESGSISIGHYLIERLYELGIRHIFGVPGDFVLGFYDLLVNSKIKVINMCDEQGAGFAAMLMPALMDWELFALLTALED